MEKRSLYQCFNARCRNGKIVCAEDHTLGNGRINILRLERGDVLEVAACQSCDDFVYMGEPIPKEERGWKDA